MNKRINRFFIALLTYAVCALLYGCSLPFDSSMLAEGNSSQETSSEKENAPTATTRVDTIKIAYNNTDSLSPYLTTSTVNINIVPLIYDSLVKLDENYNVQNLLAEDITLTAEQCVVTLRSGIKFSDGAALTATDIVYSATQVLTANSSYSGLLSGVSEVTAQEDGTVLFKLKEPDRLFANLLTFPIVREGSSLGSGRFVLQGSGDTQHLIRNPLWFGSFNGQIKNIELVNQHDKETLIYSLKLGTINYAYSDLSGNEALALGVNTRPITLNNLVYLGINTTKKLLSDVKMRQVINISLNRPQLADGAYAARATAAYTPFNPAIAEVAALGGSPQNFAEAATLMAELGYTTDQKDADGYYTTNTGRLNLRLLVNNDNLSRMQLATDIQRQLKELGIELTIDARTFNEYKAALAKWDFDLYLAETKLYNNRNITALVSNKGTLGFGAGENAALSAANSALMSGAIDTKAFMEEFNRTLPFLPLMYRGGMLALSREVQFKGSATEQDIFYNIENW